VFKTKCDVTKQNWEANWDSAECFYSGRLVGISSAKRDVSNAVELDDAW